MKLITFFLLSLFLLNCGGGTNTEETPTPSTYLLSYNDDLTQIDGQVTFDMGNIPDNHIITLSEFTPYIENCSISSFANVVTPDSITFTSSTPKQIANVAITFANECSVQTLQLKAQYNDTSIINGKTVTYTKEMTYIYSISKTTSPQSYTPVLKNNTLEITTNKQNESITVVVYDQLNRPAEKGKVSIIYPDIVANGVDVGSFSQTSVDVKAGEALFSYTAPSNLQALIDANITTTSFKFYYNDAISNYVELTLTFNPDTNQTIIKSYNLLFAPQDNSYKMSLEESKSFSVTLVDDENNVVDDTNILDLNISLENSFIAQLINSSGDTNTSFHFTNTNNTTLTLQSKTVSGLVPIHIYTHFKDINGDMKDLNKTFNIIVESGPPTSISISYSGTTQDTTRAKFIEHFAISVTDKYFNPVNTNPQVSVGAIVGYAKYQDDGIAANTDKRIYIDTAPLATLTNNTLDLNQNLIDTNTTIDLANDILVTFGAGYTYPASGGWNFDDYNATHIYLSSGQYDGNTTLNLGFAIGRNHRQDACNFGDEWLGQAKLQNDASTIDEAGTAIVELSYDYYLVGKDIVLYINIIGKDNTLNKELRIGEAKKHTLRGLGLTTGSDTTITAEDGATVVKRFYAWIEQTPEAYRNANFSFFDVVTSGKGRINSATRMPIESCTTGGHAYIEYNITADVNETFTVSVSNPVVTQEF